jgi:glycosyltransferase involved in cell wall biosynthesis
MRVRQMSSAQRHIMMTTDAVGGVWRYSTDLAHELRSTGWRVSLLCLGPPPSAEERHAVLDKGIVLHETALPLDWLAETEGDILFAADALADWAVKLDVDSIHLHSPAYATSKRFDRPVVAVSHSCLATWWKAMRGSSPMPKDFRWRTQLHRDGLFAADRVLCPSASFARLTSDTYRLVANPQVVLNGRRPFAAQFEVAPLKVEVFTSGRLWDEGKNITLVDRAAAQIATRIHAAGADRAPGRQRATFANLALLGHLGEAALASFFAQRPIFISPSIYEPFGLSVLEAADNGCALILAEIPTFRELWDGAAIFIDPHDPRALAAAVDTLLSDALARSELGRRARQRAARYSIKQMALGVATVHQHLRHPAREHVGAVA